LNNQSIDIGFIGAGNVAGLLSQALATSGYRITAVSSRSFLSAQNLASRIEGCCACPDAQNVADACNLVFITTPDMSIEYVASSVKWKNGHMVAHTSGADSRNILAMVEQSGGHSGVFHPLQTLSTGSSPSSTFKGVTFTLDADEPLLSVLEKISFDLGGVFLRLNPADRTLYHASAVFMSNYVLALAGIAVRLWQHMGFSRSESIAALLPLIKGTVGNLEVVGLPDCLTGPIARGDLQTIYRHLEELAKIDPIIEETYRLLGLSTVGLAAGKGRLSDSELLQLVNTLRPKEKTYDQNHVEK